MTRLPLLALMLAVAVNVPAARGQSWAKGHDGVIGKLGDVQVAFDVAEAERLLAPGGATLRGRRYVRPEGGLLGRRTYASEAPIYLLPMTQNMSEWLARWQGFYGAGIEHLPRPVLQYTARALTDTQGNFEFTNLAPGTYVLLSAQPFDLHGSYREKVGESVLYAVAGNVLERSPIYGPTQYYSGHFIDQLVQVVEIKRDGIVVDLGKINN